MIDHTIAEIEAQLRDSQSVRPERREELLKLLEQLKAEIGTLPPEQGEQARSIVKFAELSTHEATRTARDKQLLDLSLEGLRSSAREFENSHPKLTQVINSISHTLSSLGI
jgi:hypothetical protein